MKSARPSSKKGQGKMKLTYLFVWLAGGGLVFLATCSSLGLLKRTESQQDAENERLWELLLRPGRQ